MHVVCHPASTRRVANNVYELDHKFVSRPRSVGKRLGPDLRGAAPPPAARPAGDVVWLVGAEKVNAGFRQNRPAW